MLTKWGILKLAETKRFIRQPYAWPGGYQQALMTADGGALCSDCARQNWHQICRESMEGTNNGFRAAGVGVNWENNNLFCDHCGKQIESAYGEPEND